MVQGQEFEPLLSHPAEILAQHVDAAQHGAAGGEVEAHSKPILARCSLLPWIRVNAEPSGEGYAAWLCDDRRRTTALVNCAGILEQVDEQLLPSVYRYVGKSFQATPAQLGILTLSRALTQALSSPLAGVLGQYVDRLVVISVGAALWGTMTAIFSMCNNVAQGIPLWAMNGIGLSFLVPTSQSLIADYNTPSQRGKAFGLLQFTGTVGAFLGALYATNIGGTQLLGMEGWRFAFLTVAISSWLVGILAWLLAVDPRYTWDERYRVEKASEVAEVSTQATLKEMWQIMTIPSFRIIISQGISGSIPWNSLVFLTFYFQLLGMSDFQASVLLAVFLASSAVGGLLGGVIGDWAALRWPSHGRVFVCQLSVAIGIPLSLLLFKGLPLNSSTGTMAAYSLVLACTGLTITWAPTACNNPIMSEICPVYLRNLIYSLDQALEGAIASCGAPLVGWLAEKMFGFDGAAETTEDVQANLQKARALGNALLVFTAMPWCLSFFLYMGLHWSYPRDKLQHRGGSCGPGQ